jgi:3'-phosphoadenosine 5'-phosphosulfate sulfotransferase (PAPS reductase)/FAD synthetase
MNAPSANYVFNVHRNLIELMRNRCLEPLLINFSGGRTSAYMLRRILDMYGGSLPGEVMVTFQNTGFEAPETLDFVNQISKRWSVDVIWLEHSFDAPDRLKVVDYESASRKGEPFIELFSRARPLQNGGFGLKPLPSARRRYCTAELKIHLANRYARTILGWPTYYFSAIGFRSDERSRVDAQRRYPLQNSWINIHPLFSLNVSAGDVWDFWRNNDFDLGLSPEQGLGNCRLCFLKSGNTLKRIILSDPELAESLIKLEETERGGKGGFMTFRPDRVSYRKLREQAMTGDLGPVKENMFINDCACTG